MSRTTARFFLGCMGFLSAILAIFLAYSSHLSVSYLLGVLAGAGFGLSMVICQRRHTEKNQLSKHTNQSWRWLLFVPAVSATIVGLLRTIGSSDFQMFVLAATSSMTAVFLLWVSLVFSVAGTGRDSYNSSTTEAWRGSQERYAREQAEWRERQRRK